MQEPKKYLTALGLSDKEIIIYTSMLQGALTARDIMKSTGEKRPTVYYIVSCLEKRGLISKSATEGTIHFQIEDTKRLLAIAEEKVAESQTLKENIENILPFLTMTTSSSTEKPIVIFHEGVAAVKNTIMAMLYTKSKHIDSIVPDDNFFWQLSEEFVEHFVTQRIKKGITTRNLWEKEIDQATVKRYYEKHSEIKILPEVMHNRFKTSIFIYDDTTLYIASHKNKYCILVTSKEYADTMKAMFDGLWVGSTLHNG